MAMEIHSIVEAEKCSSTASMDWISSDDQQKLTSIMRDAAEHGFHLEVRTWISGAHSRLNGGNAWFERWPNPDTKRRRVELLERHEDDRLEVFWSSPPSEY